MGRQPLEQEAILVGVASGCEGGFFAAMFLNSFELKDQLGATMRNFLVFPLVLALLLGLVGCETIKGAGKDIEKAGEAIQRAAK